MRSEYTHMKLWLITATEQAIKVSTLPRHDPERKIFWLPKSQIEIERQDPPIFGEWTAIVADVPDWLCVKHGL
jgi:hypothetical protein